MIREHGSTANSGSTTTGRRPTADERRAGAGDVEVGQHRQVDAATPKPQSRGRREHAPMLRLVSIAPFGWPVVPDVYSCRRRRRRRADGRGRRWGGVDPPGSGPAPSSPASSSVTTRRSAGRRRATDSTVPANSGPTTTRQPRSRRGVADLGRGETPVVGTVRAPGFSPRTAARTTRACSGRGRPHVVAGSDARRRDRGADLVRPAVESANVALAPRRQRRVRRGRCGRGCGSTRRATRSPSGLRGRRRRPILTARPRPAK